MPPTIHQIALEDPEPAGSAELDAAEVAGMVAAEDVEDGVATLDWAAGRPVDAAEAAEEIGAAEEVADADGAPEGESAVAVSVTRLTCAKANKAPLVARGSEVLSVVPAA